MQYQAEGVPLIVLAGKEYGTGSSRDWAAKGPALLGVRAVIAESFERIHRSNLVGMGILPLEFLPGESTGSLNLTGHEQFTIQDIGDQLSGSFEENLEVGVTAVGQKGEEQDFRVRVRLDTPQEVLYFSNGGILQYVLRQLLETD